MREQPSGHFFEIMPHYFHFEVLMNTELNPDPFFLLHEIAEAMLERLEWMTLKPSVILDVSGSHADVLKKRYKDAKIIAGNEQEIVALADHSVDLIFANLILPWRDDLENVLREWRRLLRPEGIVLFSSLGPDTLKELRGQCESPIKLVDMHDLGDAVAKARFSDPVLDTEILTVTYREIPTMIHELQVTNMITTAQLKLERNADDVYALTYEIVYGHAFGPSLEVDQVADETGVVKIPLAHLRRRISE